MHMEYIYDPIHATYSYDRVNDPGDWDRCGGLRGSLAVDGVKRFDTWAINAGEAVFEADPCSCGVPGCGLRDVHAHRSGLFVVWTCWERRTGEREHQHNLPLIFLARGYEEALGGSIEGLPWLDGKHAARLLEEAPWAPGEQRGEVWWWERGPDEVDPAALVERLAALTVDDLAGASVVPLPGSPWVASCEDGRTFCACLVDGALAVHAGELARFPVALRVPALGSGSGAGVILNV